MPSEIYRIGAIIPLSGISGIYGPSCKACLLFAQEEINSKGGIGGHHVEILFIDGDRPPAAIGRDVGTLIDTKAVHALIGMHRSDVRDAVSIANDGRVLYVYTPTFEGGNGQPGLICFGETPSQQILPAIKWFRDEKSVRRWCFIGSDYIWPRQLKQYLESIAEAEEIEITESHFVDPGESEFGQYLDGIEQAEPDAVFFALVGDEAVYFNREFGARPNLAQKPRFGPLLEENTILAIGEENSKNIFSASAYIPSIESEQNKKFKKGYYEHAGDMAPEINTLSAASYAGLHLLSDVLPAERSYDASEIITQMEDQQFDHLIGTITFTKGLACREIFLAEVVENQLQIVHSFGALFAE